MGEKNESIERDQVGAFHFQFSNHAQSAEAFRRSIPQVIAAAIEKTADREANDPAADQVAPPAPAVDEYPPRDCRPRFDNVLNFSPPWIPQFKVTPEMIAAGNRIGLCEPVEDIYRAMHAAAPVEFCPEGRIAALESERDRALSRASHATDNWTAVARERDAAFVMRNETMAALVAMKAERDGALKQLLAERAEVAELSRIRWTLTAKLATVVGANVPDPPKPANNPFRDFPRTPRVGA